MRRLASRRASCIRCRLAQTSVTRAPRQQNFVLRSELESIAARATASACVPGSRRRFASSADGSPLERYMAMKEAGCIQADSRQDMAMVKLDDLCKQVTHYSPTGDLSPRQHAAAPAAQPSASWFEGLFGSSSSSTPSRTQKPRGLYLWGGTGTGKTLMLDLFYDAVPVDRKKRIHFREWLTTVNHRLHCLRTQHSKDNTSQGATDATSDDILAQLVDETMQEAWLLCFDEFHVIHISDAILLRRLFEALWSRGCVVVAASSSPPEDLYLNGLNRALLLPFIDMLNEFCEVYAIGADNDYRLIEDEQVYIHPSGAEAQELLEQKFSRLCRNEVRKGLQLEAQGRKLVIPMVGAHSNVAWFQFSDLCDKALEPADYLAIADAFHTVFLADIPKLTLQDREQVRCFIRLIDALYERQVKLVCSAECEPITLFDTAKQDGDSSFEEIFAWDRTVTRLVEMQSHCYLTQQVQMLDSEQFLGQFRLKSLSDEDTRDMWIRYDKDASGDIDMEELRSLLQDLLEVEKGHRNLSEEVFSVCVDTIDLNKDGVISYEEFQAYLGDFSLVQSTVR